MLRELYMRDSTDPLYTPGILEHSDEIETLIGQIRMILFTKKGDVLGHYDFGYDLESYLYDFNIDQNKLRSQILESIYIYCPDASKYSVDVQVKFFKGSVRDACLIDIFVDGTKTLGVLVK